MSQVLPFCHIRRLALKLASPAQLPRENFPVTDNRTVRKLDFRGGAVASADSVIGTVVSGTSSPTLNAGIGLAYIPPTVATPGTSIQIEIRGKRFAAEGLKKPFYRKA